MFTKFYLNVTHKTQARDKKTPLEVAKRECFEEANILFNTVLYEATLITTIPAEIYPEEYRKNWGENCFVIKEYTFAFKLTEDIIKISNEHSEFRWVTYDEAISLLKYDSNKNSFN